MEIELLTTKKKLTKSLISQMRVASEEVMREGEVLGFVIGMDKNSYRTILVKHGSDVFKVYASWTRSSVEGATSVYRKIGKWSQSWKFNSVEELEKWWVAFQRVSDAATSQIYV